MALRLENLHTKAKVSDTFMGMTITDRSDNDISKEELNAIYDDFKKLEVQDGIPPNNQRRYQFVAEENDSIVGFASGLTNHKWFFLTDMWVHEAHRRKGLGAALLKRLEEKVQSVGMEHIWTWTTGFNNPKFYESQGYTVFAVFEDFCGVKGYHQTGYRKDF